MIGGFAHEKVAAPHRFVVVTALLGRRKHEEERELGDRDGVGIADRSDGDLQRRRLRQLDIVAADAVPRDHLEPGRCRESLGAERQIAQDEAVGVRNLAAQALLIVPAPTVQMSKSVRRARRSSPASSIASCMITFDMVAPLLAIERGSRRSLPSPTDRYEVPSDGA